MNGSYERKTVQGCVQKMIDVFPHLPSFTTHPIGPIAILSERWNLRSVLDDDGGVKRITLGNDARCKD